MGLGRTHQGQRRGLMPARPFPGGFTDTMMHSAQPSSRRKWGLSRFVEISVPGVGPGLPAMTKKAMRAGTVTTPDQPDRNRLEKEWTLSAVRYIDLNSDLLPR